MIEAYPLHWPVNKKRTPAHQRKTAKFGRKEQTEYSWKATKPLSMAQACKRVLSELDKYTKVGQLIRVPEESIIISTNISIRKDGLPYSNFRKPEDPGAAVYFTLDDKPYCLPCDKWDRVEDNIAAIAAHISAMRAIERWGVGESHDVYTGFKAIPETSSFNQRSIWEILGLNKKPDNVISVKFAYRLKANEIHPDKPGGNDQAMAELNAAYRQALSQF